MVRNADAALTAVANRSEYRVSLRHPNPEPEAFPCCRDRDITQYFFPAFRARYSKMDTLKVNRLETVFCASDLESKRYRPPRPIIQDLLYPYHGWFLFKTQNTTPRGRVIHSNERKLEVSPHQSLRLAHIPTLPSMRSPNRSDRPHHSLRLCYSTW